MNYNAKSIINKYRLSLIGVGVVFVIITILLLYLTDNYFVYYLSLLVAVLSIKIFGMILYNKFFNSILTTEMNLPKYIDLIETGKFVSNNLLEHLYIAYYSGDYNKAINICNIKLENKKYEKYKHFYLLMLARCYFEMGDFENLGKVNEMFKNYVATNKNGNKIKEKFIYFKFVEFYLLGEFSAAKELYEKIYLGQKKNQNKIKLNDVSVKFTYAICCYKCGDFDKATELFNDVIATAPAFRYSELSKRYLEAIENSNEYIPEQITLDTDMSNIPIPKSRKIIKIIYAIVFLVIIIGLISSVIV
ncbi:MAG: tetratricopeptide repeat protein [Lachnospiraceae bacterium]|nr:tetratricopeptide repeat protein [Lachnospiraceae bacterium]